MDYLSIKDFVISSRNITGTNYKENNFVAHYLTLIQNFTPHTIILEKIVLNLRKII